MLNVYLNKEDIPKDIKFVNCNDAFFNSKVMEDTPEVRSALKNIDKATYNSKLTFIGRDPELGALNKQYLSTGCKTIINIATNPDICFNVVECGQNALAEMMNITVGNIYWEYPIILSVDPIKCDILVNNKHFMDSWSFSEYIERVLRFGEEE